MFKKFLKWISPIEIIFAQTPEEEVKQIDQDFKAKFEELDAKVARENEMADLLSSVVMLCHQVAISATSAHIAIQHPTLTAKLVANPEDNKVRDEINALLRDMDLSKALDQLGVNILTQVYKSYPILHTYAKNNRLFVKGYDNGKAHRLESNG